MSSLLRHAKSNVSPARAGQNPGPAVLAQLETGIIPRKQDAHFHVITEHPMNALERRTVSSLALLYSFRMLGLFMVLPLLALYAADMPGANPLTIGLALGVYGLGQAVLQIPLGWLSDLVGRKPVIVAGLVIFALGSVVAALADTIYGVLAGRALQGAGAIASTIMALAADLTRAEQRTKAMAVVGMSIGVSFALALVLGPVVAAAGGLAAVFWLTALLALGGIGIVIALVPTPAPGLLHEEVGARRGLFGRSLKDRGLLRLNFAVFALHFILMALFLIVPVQLLEVARLDRDHHWMVYLPALVLSIAGMVPMMIMAERYGRLRGMFLVAIGLLGVSTLVLASSEIALAVYVAMWLFFIGFNYLEATLPSLVSKVVFPGGKGTALGIYATCQFLGAFAGGAVGGWLLKYSGPSSLVAACLLLAGLWLVLFLPSNSVAAAPVTAAGE